MLREKFAPKAMKISYSSLESTYAIGTLTKFFLFQRVTESIENFLKNGKNSKKITYGSRHFESCI